MEALDSAASQEVLRSWGWETVSLQPLGYLHVVPWVLEFSQRVVLRGSRLNFSCSVSLHGSRYNHLLALTHCSATAFNHLVWLGAAQWEPQNLCYAVSSNLKKCDCNKTILFTKLTASVYFVWCYKVNWGSRAGGRCFTIPKNRDAVG